MEILFAGGYCHIHIFIQFLKVGWIFACLVLLLLLCFGLVLFVFFCSFGFVCWFVCWFVCGFWFGFVYFIFILFTSGTNR